MSLKKLLSKIMCKHQFEKIGWDEVEENNIRFSVRYYQCKKCGKIVTVDGRYDPFMERRRVVRSF